MDWIKGVRTIGLCIVGLATLVLLAHFKAPPEYGFYALGMITCAMGVKAVQKYKNGGQD